ncbi:OmpW family protein [Parvibaculum sp.]|jgi:outer membrane protein|uniref:OmpW/AlkL family protein n=1 Tax=Parvibaculum sp. TaxID=2024848 RepID=UPI0025ECC8EF|nr:OmpW family protein [Parvibaculum sp.]
MKGNMKYSALGKIALGVVLAAGMVAAAPAAQAADGFKGKSAGDFVVRARAIGVIPRDNADSASIPGEPDVSNEYVPELDFTYFITDNVALELIAATTRHDVKWNIGGTQLDLGKVNLLPPTLTVQYHFMPKERLSPYVGAGLNYTIFYNEDAGSSITSIDYENSLGYALQAGVDYALDDNWSLNLDVKKLWLDTDVKINGGAVTANVNLDPWIVGVGVGYRF